VDQVNQSNMPYPDAKGLQLEMFVLVNFDLESSLLRCEKSFVLSVKGALEIIISKSRSASST
jgi:hypothetical protein